MGLSSKWYKAQCVCSDTDSQQLHFCGNFLGYCLRSVSADVNKLFGSNLNNLFQHMHVVLDFHVYRIVSPRLELSWKGLEA